MVSKSSRLSLVGNAGRRFVEQQKLRFRSQRQGDLDQALLAIREVARLFVGDVGKAQAGQ